MFARLDYAAQMLGSVARAMPFVVLDVGSALEIATSVQHEMRAWSLLPRLPLLGMAILVGETRAMSVRLGCAVRQPASVGWETFIAIMDARRDMEIAKTVQHETLVWNLLLWLPLLETAILVGGTKAMSAMWGCAVRHSASVGWETFIAIMDARRGTETASSARHGRLPCVVRRLRVRQ
jgi:hypothetical protein